MNKFVQVLAVAAEMKEKKVEFSGAENVIPLIEAACQDFGVSQLTIEQTRELTESDNAPLAGLITERSIRGVAINKGYYKKKTPEQKAAENGTSQTRKAEYVSAVETSLSLPKGSLESLGKGKKGELELLAQAIIAHSDHLDAEAE